MPLALVEKHIGQVEQGSLEDVVPPEVQALVAADDQRAIPAIAKTPALINAVELAVHRLSTRHKFLLGDSREQLAQVSSDSVHLVVTSPPYWTLKEYPHRQGQLGDVVDYDIFLDQLDDV